MFVQMPSGVTEKDITLVYDDRRRIFGVRFARPLHPELQQAVFWAAEDALVRIKRLGGIQYLGVTIQLPQGTGSKQAVATYNADRAMIAFRFHDTRNAELQKAVFWIREADLVEVKTSGIASLVA